METLGLYFDAVNYLLVLHCNLANKNKYFTSRLHFCEINCLRDFEIVFGE